MIKPGQKYRDFQRSEVKRLELIRILELPELREALDAIKDSARPTNLPEPVIGQAYDITVAHSFHEMLGAGQAVNMLYGLCNAPTKLLPLDQEYFHAIPKEYQQQ